MSEGTEIRQGCQFISSLVRALAKLLGGLGRFLPCKIGSGIINALRLSVCGCGLPSGFSFGALQLRHCTTLCSMRFPPWSLPMDGNGGGKSCSLLLVIILMVVVIEVKGPAHQKDTS